MAGMETLEFEFEFAGAASSGSFAPVLVGVVASGNLEVLMETHPAAGCRMTIETSARGFGHIWEAVLRDFQERHALTGVTISIHDMGATPAVVSLRLDQAVSSLRAGGGAAP